MVITPVDQGRETVNKKAKAIRHYSLARKLILW
jgi:hypothetical protein